MEINLLLALRRLREEQGISVTQPSQWIPSRGTSALLQVTWPHKPLVAALAAFAAVDVHPAGVIQAVSLGRPRRAPLVRITAV